MKTVAIIGTGPAALMAATVLSRRGLQAFVFEKRRSPGRKFLVAGSSGLNITNSMPTAEFVKQYSGAAEFWERVLSEFTPQNWIEFIHGLGEETFLGTSGRYFVKSMKASKLLRAWIRQLHEGGVHFFYEHEWSGLGAASDASSSDAKIEVQFLNQKPFEADAVILALGGGSWERDEKPLRWVSVVERMGVAVSLFQSANCGFNVHWSPAFLSEAEGKPLKNIRLRTSKGEMAGDMVVTRYGLEGTPIYTLGEVGTAFLNLKPDMTLEQMRVRCRDTQENLSPIRRVQKKLNLSDAAMALLFHHSQGSDRADLDRLLEKVGAFPLQLQSPRPLEEAISSHGGIQFSELDENLMLRQHPQVYAIGEMVDWSAPTGGFLIQGAVSMGAYVAKRI